VAPADRAGSLSKGSGKLNMRHKPLYLAGVLAVFGPLHTPLYATVTILSMTPSVASPQPPGTTVTWTVTATDTNPGGLLTFQFNVAAPAQAFSLSRDFNAGTLASGTWTSPPFVWTDIAGEGTYQVQVIAEDFGSGETATQTASFRLTPLVTGGNAVVNQTANPLVALFSAPSCATGSSMRVAFAASGSSPNYTSWNPCKSPLSMNFYVAGMRASTTYSMNYQVLTNGKATSGPTPLNLTTGALPSQINFPPFTVVTRLPTADTTDTTLLHAVTANNGSGSFLPMATDLSGNITWFYALGDAALLTRPVTGGYMLSLQNGVASNPALSLTQYVRETDLAGNIIRETNTGIISQELLALGATDATPCNGIPIPPPVGTTCLNHFHHEAIQLPNGYTAILGRIEKLFPPGTQGSTTGQPVDIIGDMAIVLDTNWQAVWYFDEFQQLNINRAAPLGETCVNGTNGGEGTCLMTLVLADVANDWTHTNCIYYISASGDLMISVRNQDWLLKVDYNNGAGEGDILWRMGIDGDFQIISDSPFPWFSHQHDAEYQSNGALTVFDNGNTRVAPPPIGLGSGYSRGMALTVDETNMQVTPILCMPLGSYAYAMGSAALLSNGNYLFQPGLPISHDIQILPSPGTITGSQVFNLSSPTYSYRAWQIPSLYQRPTN
jgi:arylsulfate sulfotransferase